MTDRTTRLALAAAEALHALAEALTDWVEDGLPDRAASDRYAANEERQREQEMEDAWQSRDWETVRRLQDEAEQRDAAPVPDPLDENDHRRRHDRDGMDYTRRDGGGWCEIGCGCRGVWCLAELEHYSGPLTFCDCETIDAEGVPEDGAPAPEPLDELLCPECGHEIDSHGWDGDYALTCCRECDEPDDCRKAPSDIARELIARAIKTERGADHD